jgi:hypothetical protein
LLLLLQKKFDEGWKRNDDRLQIAPWKVQQPVASKPRWAGESLAGKKLLLQSEQGFGDTIMFARFAPLLADRGAEVIFSCPQPLHRLMRSLKGVSWLLTDGDALPTFDLHSPLMSLGNCLSITADNIPANVPYLRADASLIEKWKAKLAGGTERFRVGLVWAGRAGHANDRNRSIDPTHLAPLGDVAGVEFVSLQKDSNDSDKPLSSLSDYSKELTDFAETAALIESLDLVISIDSAVAHLAGALGRPVWMLLPNVPDWRWMLDRDDSPWYPTMKLFRQPADRDWKSVIARVKNQLTLTVARGNEPK